MTQEGENETEERVIHPATTSDRVLRNRANIKGNIDYGVLHRTGERQSRQMHQLGKTKDRTNKHYKGKKKKKKIRIHIKDTYRQVVGAMMANIAKSNTTKSKGKHAQLNVKQGIDKHGQKAIEAILTEYSQLDDRDVFDPQDVSKLNSEQRRGALNLLTMVQEKRSGKIKGRAVADGRKQRHYISKEDAASPTVQLESLMLSLIVDAHEGRDVATADVVGAYLLADMDDYVLVKIGGDAAQIMKRVNKNYEQFVATENGKEVLYMKLKKALYGCMQSAILWYGTFKNSLEGMGFKINEYDPCVANLKINGKQCTICWYVDDTKILHVDPRVVDHIIKKREDSLAR